MSAEEKQRICGVFKLDSLECIDAYSRPEAATNNPLHGELGFSATRKEEKLFSDSDASVDEMTEAEFEKEVEKEASQDVFAQEIIQTVLKGREAVRVYDVSDFSGKSH